MGTAGDFTCSAEINSACAKVLAIGPNACTAQMRRRPEGRSFRAVNIQIDLTFHPKFPRIPCKCEASGGYSFAKVPVLSLIGLLFSPKLRPLLWRRPRAGEPQRGGGGAQPVESLGFLRLVWYNCTTRRDRGDRRRAAPASVLSPVRTIESLRAGAPAGCGYGASAAGTDTVPAWARGETL